MKALKFPAAYTFLLRVFINWPSLLVWKIVKSEQFTLTRQKSAMIGGLLNYGSLIQLLVSMTIEVLNIYHITSMGMTVQSAKQMVSLQLQKYKHHNILDVIPNIFATTPRFMEIGHVNEYPMKYPIHWSTDIPQCII